MDLGEVFDVCLTSEGFLWPLSTREIAMLPRICRAFKAAYSQNLHTVWSIYTACLEADYADELLARMFAADPELGAVTYRARAQVFVGEPARKGWVFPVSAAKAGCLGSIRGASRHITASRLAVMLVSSNDNEPEEWVWWATALIEMPTAQGDVKNYLTISLLSVKCFDDDELDAICAHMRYMVDTSTIYALLCTVRDDDSDFFRPRTRNLYVLLRAFEVRLGWRDEEFRKAIRSTLGCRNLLLCFVLALVSGYYEDRSIQFAMRKELRASGYDPRQFHMKLERTREMLS